MTEKRDTFGKLADLLRDKLAEVMGAPSPETDAIPIPVRDDPRRRRR
jgi:hypothetical protein